MSSVRIRKTPSEYVSLRDAQQHGLPEPAPFPRRQRLGSLAGVFGSSFNQLAPSNDASVGHPANAPKPRMRRRTTSGASFNDNVPPRPPISRPRSGSRVAEHLRSSRKISGAPPPAIHHGPISIIYEASGSQPSRSTGQPPRPGYIVHGEETVTLQGSQADVLMRTQSGDRTPGVVESALSLPQSVDTDVMRQIDELHHHHDIVEHLDVIDPQIATVSNLANAANAILIPPLYFYSRKPVVMLSSPTRRQRARDIEKGRQPDADFDDVDDSLDRHVEDVLTRRAKFKRTMQGVWSFLKTPMGVVTGIYGFLVVFWGAALVLFLLKWINFHNANTQGFWVEVGSQVECGLFTATGIGLIPARALDTYRVYKIWLYKRRTRKLREKAGLPQLFDIDDLPDPMYDPNYVHVLSGAEQQDLHHQQERFRESQTWYRPHGTETHRAFPINTALWICLFIDGNSIFQIMLSSCMWSMNRFERPAWTTGTLIPASFICGIVSAVLIWRGGQQTRRTEKVEETLRIALAMERGEKPRHSQVIAEQGPLAPPETALKRISPSHGISNDPANGRDALHLKESFVTSPSIGSPVIDEQMIIPDISEAQ